MNGGDPQIIVCDSSFYLFDRSICIRNTSYFLCWILTYNIP